jgi:O-antigen ligase
LWLIFVLFSVLPFERIPSHSLFGFTVKLSYIIGVILLLITGLLYWKKQIKIQWFEADKALMVLWVMALLSLTQTTILSRGLVIAAMWLFMFLLFIVVSNYLRSKEMIQKTEMIILGATTLVCLFGIYQFIGDSLGLSHSITGLRDLYAKEVLGYPRIQSVALEPLYFSNYLLLPLFVAMRRVLEEKTWRSYSFFVTTLIGVNIILGVSRGAYLAVVIGIGVVLGWAIWCSMRKQGEQLAHLKNWTRLLGALILSVIVSALMVVSFRGYTVSQSLLGHVQVDDTKSGTSVPGRLETYRIAGNYFLKHPIFGIGLGDFGPRTLTSQAEFNKYGYGIVNNEYLEIASETGLLGLFAAICFLWFYSKELISAYRNAGSNKRWRIVFLVAILVAFLIQYNFFSTLYIIYLWVFLAWIRASAAVESEN